MTYEQFKVKITKELELVEKKIKAERENQHYIGLSVFTYHCLVKEKALVQYKNALLYILNSWEPDSDFPFEERLTSLAKFFVKDYLSHLRRHVEEDGVPSRLFEKEVNILFRKKIVIFFKEYIPEEYKVVTEDLIW